MVAHLPSEARSQSLELWLSQNRIEPVESTLGLKWNCSTDVWGLSSGQAPVTMQRIYQVLAQQYDPLGFLTPFLTRAKILVQRLWSKKREWDDPNLPADLRVAWEAWEEELPGLQSISIPRCYTPADRPEAVTQELHVFCDASEQAYGAVAYLVTKYNNECHSSFVMARSRVAPKRQLSMPRLELCGALAGAQLAQLIQRELDITSQRIALWTDSTTVLEWLQSESCRFKVFVGVRVAEIQELTEPLSWRYVDSSNNPADDITRGKTLTDLSQPSRWRNGPAFLKQPNDSWPARPKHAVTSDTSELRRITFCSLTTTNTQDQQNFDLSQYSSWKDLVQDTYNNLTAQIAGDAALATYKDSEITLLKQCQAESFPVELKSLRSGTPLPRHSKLRALAPELDKVSGLIRVGGRLRNVLSPTEISVHPVVLDPDHQITRLLIRDFDERLLHPGPERVFSELRRHYWVLRGRQAVKTPSVILLCLPLVASKAQSAPDGEPSTCSSETVKPSILFHRSGLFWPVHSQSWKTQ